MRRVSNRKAGKKSQKPELNFDGDDAQCELASVLTEEEHELATASDEGNTSTQLK